MAAYGKDKCQPAADSDKWVNCKYPSSRPMIGAVFLIQKTSTIHGTLVLLLPVTVAPFKSVILIFLLVWPSFMERTYDA